MKRKKPYLLLELLIALSLVSLFALPLIENPLSSLQSEVQTLQKMELERHSELIFADIKAKLYSNEIPWKTIIKQSSNEPDFTGKVIIPIGDVSNSIFNYSVFIWSEMEKKGKDQKEHHRIKVRIRFIPPKKTKQLRPMNFQHKLHVALSPPQAAPPDKPLEKENLK